MSTEATTLLILVSLSFGVVSAIFVGTLTHNVGYRILTLVVASIAYLLIGSPAISICARLRKRVYKAEVEDWTRDEKAKRGAFWPFVLVPCVFVYVFVWIIKRVY